MEQKSANLGRIDVIKQLLALVLNCLPSDVALCSGTRESTTLDDNDVFGGGDTLMDIVTRIEFPRSQNDLFLEFLGVHDTLLRNLDKQGGRRSAVSNDNALGNEFTARSTNPVLD